VPPDLKSIDHVHVHVADRAAAERWYALVLGLTRHPGLAFWATDGGPLTLRDPGDRVHLALFEGGPAPHRTTVAFGVDGDDFLRWRQHLAATLGREPRAVDHEVSWSLYFSDPDGNPYEITTHEHAAVRPALQGAALGEGGR